MADSIIDRPVGLFTALLIQVNFLFADLVHL